jgi:hypothetical protein
MKKSGSPTKSAGMKKKNPAPFTASGDLKTNKDRLITTLVEAVVHPASSRGYSTTYDGKPKLGIGLASINYTVSPGDLALDDRVQVRARGVGLKIKGFEDVRVNKLSPELLERIGIGIKKGKLVIPVVMEIPGHIMGSGLGYSPIEALDYDIQTTDPTIVEQYRLKKLRIGDLVAIRDHYDYYGCGRYKGAVTIGVCVHGWSDHAWHGPGLNPKVPVGSNHYGFK